MGAAVLLYNRQQRLLGRVLTDDHGEFKLLGLVPAPYSVKISLASFVPATKEILDRYTAAVQALAGEGVKIAGKLATASFCACDCSTRVMPRWVVVAINSP